jgi:hypothetical protein
MGQARARGTYEERKAAAIERDRKLAEERYGGLSEAHLASARLRSRRLSPKDLRALAALNMIVMTSQDFARIHRLG